MRFSFSTLSCPKWDFPTILARAKEYGYDGVEVRGFLNESILTATNVFLTDPRKVREQFADAGVSISCLSSSIAMTGRRRDDARLAADVRRYIDSAAGMGCRYVRVFDTQVRPGQTRAEAAGTLATWLLPLADYAAEHDVTLLVKNALSFRNAREMWLILEMASNHPGFAVCWDPFNAALASEPPSISIPTLNSRIQYVQVKDAKLGALGATYTKLGDGDIRIPDLMRRLMGIGYTGWVSLEWEKAWLPNLAEPEEILPDAIAKLRTWTKPQTEEEGAESDAAPAAAK